MKTYHDTYTVTPTWLESSPREGAAIVIGGLLLVIALVAFAAIAGA